MLTPDKANQKQMRKSLPYKRKFPGPAGLASDFAPGEVEELLFRESGLKEMSNNAVLLGSTYSNLALSKPCYQKLIQDFYLSELNNPLNHLTLDMVAKTSGRKGRRDLKVPFLGLIVSSISHNSDKSKGLKLMDPTCEVNAVLQADIWHEFADDIKVNSVFALSEVPVITSCTSRPPITLFVSRKNILSVYMEADGSDVVETKTFNRVSQEDLKSRCRNWLTQMGLNLSVPKPAATVQQVVRPPPAKTNDKPAEPDCGSRFRWNPEEVLTDLNFSLDDFNDSMDSSTPWTTTSSSSSSSSSSLSSPSVKPANSRFERKSGAAELVSDPDRRPEHLERTQCETPGSSSRGEETKKSKELSPTEKLMVQEVLSGIDFDDFDC